MNCIQYQGYDPNCNINFKFNEGLLPAQTRVQLSTYWPQILISNDIKQDSWYEHGTCYISIIETLNTSFIGKQLSLFQYYFKSPILKTKKLNLTVKKLTYQNKSQLSLAIGVKPEQYHALCEYDPDYLSSIAICYELNSSPGNQSLIPCPTILSNQCEFPVKIRIKFQQHIQLLSWLCFFILVLLYS